MKPIILIALVSVIFIAGCTGTTIDTTVDTTVETTAEATTTAEEQASISVSNNLLQGDNEDQVLINSLFLDQPGFVVIHADDDGTFGEVIGNSEVLEGEVTDLLVTVDKDKAGTIVHAMLHYDDDNDGEYGFPDEDAPTSVNEEVVSKEISLIEAMEATTTIEETTTTEGVQVKEFTMVAKRWDFEPSTITVNEGDTVRLIINSIDVAHGFAISTFGVNERLNAGETVTVEFVADRKGTFSFFCSVFCGSGHGGMRGSLIVE